MQPYHCTDPLPVEVWPMKVAQDRPSDRNCSAFYHDDQRVSDSVIPHQPLIQNNSWRVTQGDKVGNRPNHKNRRNHTDCPKP